MMTPWLAACVVLVGCSDPLPTEPASGATDQVAAAPLDVADRAGDRVSFEWQYVSTWCHEDIAFEGVFTNHWHRVLTDSGRWSYVANYRDEGTGVGLTSGATYRWMTQGTFHQNLDLNDFDPWVEKEVNLIKILGDGSAPNILGKYSFNYTWTPAGDLVVDRQSFEVSCVG